MDKILTELNQLIAVRDYVINTINNPAVDKLTYRELQGIYLLLDRKIIGLIQSLEFKEYIGFKDVKKVTQEVASITNIKSAFKKPQ